jgi:hypothetical protein
MSVLICRACSNDAGFSDEQFDLALAREDNPPGCEVCNRDDTGPCTLTKSLYGSPKHGDEPGAYPFGPPEREP